MKKARQVPLRGRLTVPGDKSISHRALILAAVARGRSTVRGLNGGADVESTLGCLAALGIAFSDRRKTEVQVDSLGFDSLAEAEAVLDAGNSGTTLRLLAGVCAAVPGHHVLTGDDSLRGRPMLRVVEPLTAMGARITGRQGGRLPPLAVEGGSLRGIEYELPVASAQVKSALLLAGLRAHGKTTVIERTVSRDHTERMLPWAGVRIERDGLKVALEGEAEVEPRDWMVPGDISSAFFLIVAACLTPGSDLAIENVGLNPTRTGGLEALKAMGAEIEWEVTGEEDPEPMGVVTVRHSELGPTVIDPEMVPRLIDEIPALAIAATQAEGITRFNSVGELRVKESDRLGGLTSALRSLGARIEEFDDGFSVEGPTPLVGGVLEARGDHRMALAGALAGLVADGDVRIQGWSSVDTSFPEFLDKLGEARGRR